MGTISQDHSKLDSDTIAEAMKPLARFNYTISYRKAWLAKQKSIAKVFGGWEESYQTLSLWFLAMVQKMPGSKVQIETQPLYNGSQEVDGVRILHRVFWSFNPYIRAFKYCKPLVQKRWRGIISDRHESIQAAVNRCGGDWKPPRAWWMFCTRHIGNNFLREFKVPYLQKLMVNIGYSRTAEEYNANYRRLQERGKIYVHWCDNIDRPPCQGARNLPILALVRAPCYRLNELFTRKGTEAYQCKCAGFTFSEFATQKIEANMHRAGNIIVNRFDSKIEVFEVREMPSEKVLVVDLARRRCDCGHFQVE
ncbi:hypothetical protein Ahy_B03g062540 [Arachis hypogaea]|uniref:MULE transposase domain-containing protein n=1 Tax=Arachis hypogaea TaxID=3818 RepID=A0A444ZUF9_ARAHY|nr:hypothetical protein Ahy_B03g062540 [Arachis hypogaea]